MSVESIRELALLGWNTVRRRLSLVLLIVGAVLLGYVAWAYGSMYFEQQRLAKEWQRQQEQQRQAEHTNTAPAPVSAEDTLTLLTAPKINLASVVVEGTDERALRLGPGHMTDSPEPGEIGNAVISGHRDTFFRHLNDLQEGDEVLVERGGKTFHYKVTGKRIVRPNEVDVIAPTRDAEMTLITCYPIYYIGPAPKRLVVTSKLVNQPEQTAAAAPQ